MGQRQFTVANQTLCLQYEQGGKGTLVRLDDGLEAHFSSPECLPHLLEGMVGRRFWQAHRERIVAELAHVLPCA